MNMKYEINANTLKQLCDVIMVFDDEIKITIGGDKWGIRTVDPVHVKMADIEIRNTVFDTYDNGYINGDMAEPVEIGIDLSKLNTFLKVFTDGQRKRKNITIDFDTEKGTCTYVIGNLTRKGKLLDAGNMNDPKVPDNNFHVQFNTTAQDLLSAVRSAKGVTDYLVFSSNNGMFRINAVGDTDTDIYDFPDATINDECYSAMYSIDHVYDLLRHIRKGNLHISSATDYPLKIEHTTDAGIHYNLLMAPRIEDSEDRPAPEPEEVQGQPEPKPEEIREDQPEPTPDPEPEPKPEPEIMDIPTEPVNVAEDLKVMGEEHREDRDDRIRNTETGEAARVLGWTGNNEGATVQLDDGHITWWRKDLVEVEA